MTGITDTVEKANIHFFIIFHSVLLRMRNISDKTSRENQNTGFFVSKIVAFMR